MLLLFMLIMWQKQTWSQHQLNMYNTDHSQDRNCLLYYVQDNIVRNHQYILAHQIIPYCLRPSDDNNSIVDFNLDNNTTDLNFTFDELREKNVSSRELLSWSASIDLAERYEIFLNNVSHSLSDKEILFYNCTSPWFGPFCRFALDLEIDESFDDIVVFNFVYKSKISNDTKATCYKHLDCHTSLCLDWREICDRKIDCYDGSDEINCWQLEMNECAENEYRCHNGQCIPVEFFRDVQRNPDCLDRTDESDIGYFGPEYCPRDPAFRCEEHTCRPAEFDFPCGDGQCTWKIAPLEYCLNGRHNLLLDNPCSIAIACAMKLYDQIDYEWCEEFCADIRCVQNRCPLLYEFPSVPIAFGHVRFMFINKEREIVWNHILLPDYVCYNEKLCADYLPATVSLNDSTCRYFHELELNQSSFDSSFMLVKHVADRFRGCLIILNETSDCNDLTMYRCSNSTKCISKHRLVDGFDDCPFYDDETFNQSCSLNDAHRRFTCSVSNLTKCFAPLTIENSVNNCENGEDERQENVEFQETRIYFPTICDGITEMLPLIIDGQNQTDETECEHWLCNNTYTRCDRFWSCLDGADEVNCPPSSCPEKEHNCVFPNDTSKVSCLPMARAGDGIVDCLGASDERNHCRTAESSSFQYFFQCRNDTMCIDGLNTYLCNNETDCPFGDDETFCTTYHFHNFFSCYWIVPSPPEVEDFLCRSFRGVIRPLMIYFTLHNMPTYSLQLTTETFSVTSSTPSKTLSIQSNPIGYDRYAEVWRCHRGIPIHFRMENNTSKLLCLCPPSYYGDQCQYQNQRISLTLQIRLTAERRTVFTFLLILIDDQENIESYDSIEYLSIRDCDTKFNVYLLYSTRPKNLSKNYSIRIDAFNKLTLNYRVSWIFPLRFPFLPVHRLPVLLLVPYSNSEPHQQRCIPSCIHGQCFAYVNSPNLTFCRCSPGWSGAQCNVEHICDCASGSLCIGDSICVCPPGRFGPRCYLPQSPCHSESCVNGGQCVPADERHTAEDLNEPTCICPDEYSGDRCEHQQTRIDVRFHKTFSIPPSLLIHLITVHNEAEPTRTSTMKKIVFDQNSVSFYISIQFNIAFAEMLNDYYLIILQEQAIVSAIISTEIVPSYRCLSMNELFNETIASQHLLRRIKYYHIPCQQRHELVCFYDDVHFCLCDIYRRANCFEFDHNMTYDCHGYSSCENGGQCFQDDPKCPKVSLCVCPECFYGSRCQFSTKGSTLSLDAILGYGIHSNVSINRQPIVVKVAISLTTIVFALGLLSSLLSSVTFQTRKTRDVGCGLYLFGSSITSLITMSVFIVKFWILLVLQMGSIKNRSFLHIQCVSLDFLLRVCVSASDWLSACVAIERAVNVSKGINFDKSKSKRVAKWTILLVFLFTISTHIHDPMHRHLVDDAEEKRTWCVTKYSPFLQMFDRALNIVHFSFPFSINCISALIIILTAARTRSNAQKKQSHMQLLREQFQHHKHLLISPFILVLLALPRLIISFLSRCMKSARNPWLYLIGYYISFIPPMMTFIVFVLPSEMYKKEFKESFKRFRQQ